LSTTSFNRIFSLSFTMHDMEKPFLSYASRALRCPSALLVAVAGLVPAQAHAYGMLAFETQPGIAAGAGCALVPQASPLPEQPQAALVFVKSEAILGGARSKLDEMRAQQAGTEAKMTVQAPVVTFADFRGAPTPGAFQSVAPPMACLMQPQPVAAFCAPTGTTACALARYRTTRCVRFGRHCRVAHPIGCPLASGAGPWSGVIHEVRGQSRDVQITKVNSWVNARISFVEDKRQFGVADRWIGAEHLALMAA
jgi:predicted transglutaminase-like cysteine proteinase